ncbi:auxin response factor 2-like [Canna indica]|uniref:Auxin response factor 2-like n=1 Tax=Canna indica TaxID=4628 RepID=A0AAQ3Q5R2_9LILI|nr:auxin response factor 2-like [Canna indica]
MRRSRTGGGGDEGNGADNEGEGGVSVDGGSAMRRRCRRREVGARKRSVAEATTRSTAEREESGGKRKDPRTAPALLQNPPRRNIPQITRKPATARRFAAHHDEEEEESEHPAHYDALLPAATTEGAFQATSICLELWPRSIDHIFFLFKPSIGCSSSRPPESPSSAGIHTSNGFPPSGRSALSRSCRRIRRRAAYLSRGHRRPVFELAAAAELQKVYCSYLTRRRLIDSVVVVEELRAGSSDFIVSYWKFAKSFNSMISVGMRFRMIYESDDATERRSMPTSDALDVVAKNLNLKFFEVCITWNLDLGKHLIA